MSSTAGGLLAAPTGLTMQLDCNVCMAADYPAVQAATKSQKTA